MQFDTYALWFTAVYGAAVCLLCWFSLRQVKRHDQIRAMRRRWAQERRDLVAARLIFEHKSGSKL